MKEVLDGFFKTKILLPIKNQLAQGVSPLGLARTCATGVILSIIPLLGATTALCVLVGIKFKLNQPLLQLVNYLFYPVQLVLLPVFMYLGARLTGTPPVAFNPKLVVSEFSVDPSLFMKHYGMAGLHAVIVWVLICPFVFKIIEVICVRLFTKWRKQ